MVCFPRHAASAPKARMQHLHWVSADRVDIPQQPAAVARLAPAWAKCGSRPAQSEEAASRFSSARRVLVGWAKARLRRAHRCFGMVGTLPDAFARGRFAHPTKSTKSP